MSNTVNSSFRRARVLIDAIHRFLFGRDFFIAYARNDATAYVAALTSQISPEYSCYVDQVAVPRGNELPAAIRHELGRVSALILVGSAGACRSTYVHAELLEFLKRERPVFLIDIERDLDQAAWSDSPWRELRGVFRQPESRNALQNATPSLAVLKYLRDSATFFKQARRLFVTSATATLILVVAIAASSLLTRQTSIALRSARDAEGRAASANQLAHDAERRVAFADQQSQDAERRAASANQQSQDAERRAASANQQSQDAERRAASANQQAQDAESRAKDAKNDAEKALADKEEATLQALEQQRIARSRRTAADADSMIAVRPELAMLLGANALALHSTAEARRALIRVFTRYPDLRGSIRGEHRDSIVSVRTCPTGRLFATADSRGDTKVWNAKDRRPILHVAPPSRTSNKVRLAFNQSCTLLAFSLEALKDSSQPTADITEFTRIELWDLRSGKHLVSLPDRGAFSFAFTTDTQIAVGRPHSIEFWDLSLPTPAVTKITDVPRVATIAGSPDGRVLVLATPQGVRACASAMCEQSWTTLPLPPSGRRSSKWTRLDVSMNGSEYLVGATDDASRSAFWLFRSQPGVPSFSAQVAQLLKNSATFEAFSPDGGRLVVSSPIDVIATNHIRERTLAQATGTGIEGAPDLGVSSVTFLDDRVLITGHSDGSIGFWEIDGGPIFSTNWSPDEALGHDGGQFAMSGNGARLAHTADDRRIVLWGLPNGRRLSEFVATPSGSIDALALSPDGEMIGYIVDTKEEGPYELWLRRADGLLVYRARLPRASSGLEERYDNAQSQLRFSRAGNEMLLAVATEDGTVTVWDLRRPEEPKLIAGPSYEPSPVMIAIHPNHTIFATAAANGHLRLWNRAVATSTLLDTAAPPASRYGAALAFARDGQTLIGIFDLHEEGITLSSWNVSTEPVRRINVPFYFSEEARLNRQSVTQPSFITISGESGLIAAEDDGSVSIWNLDPVALVLEDLHSHVIADFIRFTDDGTRLFVVGYTGVTQVDIGDNALIGNACKIVGARPFRADEEARYLGGVPPVLDCKKYSTLGDSAASRKGPTTGR